MPFLTVNGVTFSVRAGSANRSIVRKGKRSRAYRGQMRNATRGKRRKQVFQACFKDFEFAETMIDVINGDGHLVNFINGVDATTSLQPEVGSWANTRLDKATGPFTGFEAGCLESEGADLLFRYKAQLGDESTIHTWAKVDTAVWKPHTFRSDGIYYVDGVRQDSSFNYGGVTIGNLEIAVRGGSLDLTGTGSDITRYSNLAILPYWAHTDFIEAWHASTKPWSGLPALRVEGDALVTDHEMFFGEVTGVGFIGKPREVAPWGWLNNAQIVEFTLDEVADGFVYDDTVPAP